MSTNSRACVPCGNGPDIRSNSDGYPGCKLLAKFLGMQVEHLALLRRLRRRGSVIGKVLGNRERRHGEDLFFTHQPHGLVAELVGMIDGNNAGPCGIQRARLPGGMDSDALAGARSLLYGSAEFGFSILVRRRKVAIT